MFANAEPQSPPRWALVWRTILAAQIAAALVWWWMMPGGFPIDHPRFWVNQVIPWAVVALSVAGIQAIHGRRAKFFEPLLLVWPVLWTAATVTGLLLFPISSRRLVLPLLGTGALYWISWWLTCRPRHAAWSSLAAALVLGTLVGVCLPWSQQAPAADTVPADTPLANCPTGTTANQIVTSFPLGDRVAVQPVLGEVTVNCGALRLEVQPLLTFESRSPDRCWTILAPESRRESPIRKLVNFANDGSESCLRYRDDAEHVLQVGLADDGQTVWIDAQTELSASVYSHLNSYCEFWIRGHQQLQVSFSPCPDTLIDVLPADYPVGRPARMAYLDAAGLFHVVEAKSGEKGPFRSLASGPLTKAAPLTITLHDRSQPVCRLTLDDWAAQVGTALSPTAGWGLPVGAIEFQLNSTDPASAAMLYLTLAGTSVGRGWDSVGHRAGTYRNRVRIEAIAIP